MTRPDDSLLDAQQLAFVQKHADRLLREASAIGRFPTPVDDLLEAAKLVLVDDEVLNENVLRQFMRKAKAGFATLKSALSKVLGLYEATDRLIVIDRDAPDARVPFIKLHEAGHGTLPHQSQVYKLIHDCEKTLDADIADLFEREANVFASEVMFQGAGFSEEAHGQGFSIRIPMALSKKYGASNYSTFRRYTTTNPHVCCVVVLEKPICGEDGEFSHALVRRVVASKSFEKVYDCIPLGKTVTAAHPVWPALPRKGKRMSFQREVRLTDRNGEERLCHAEAFYTGHQVLILMLDIGLRKKAGIIVPGKIMLHSA
jgi:Zn-dependent peptidase ImmA (M78 family)